MSKKYNVTQESRLNKTHITIRGMRSARFRKSEPSASLKLTAIMKASVQKAEIDRITDDFIL